MATGEMKHYVALVAALEQNLSHGHNSTKDRQILQATMSKIT
jgi:hypothetical protein